MVDGPKLEQFVFRAVDEVGATLNTALVVMGDKLGLYRALAGAGPLAPAELAERTGTAERYVREWLNAQAAGGFVDYDPDSGRYTLPPEQAVALTDRGKPGLPARVFPDRPGLRARLTQDHRGGTQRRRVWLARACARRPRGMRTLLPARLQREPDRPGGCPRSTAWSPSCERGALVADVGCGYGASTILMAQAFPNSTFVGSDYHGGSIETARRSAQEAGVARGSASKPRRRQPTAAPATIS